MLWVHGQKKYFNFFQCGGRLYTSECDSDVFLTYKDGPGAEKVISPPAYSQLRVLAEHFN